jgi:actin-related protein
MIPGFPERFSFELSKYIDVVVKASDKRCHMAFIGGGKFCSRLSTENLWISKEEYQEIGPSVVQRKCF